MGPCRGAGLRSCGARLPRGRLVRNGATARGRGSRHSRADRVVRARSRSGARGRERRLRSPSPSLQLVGAAQRTARGRPLVARRHVSLGPPPSGFASFPAALGGVEGYGLLAAAGALSWPRRRGLRDLAACSVRRARARLGLRHAPRGCSSGLSPVPSPHRRRRELEPRLLLASHRWPGSPGVSRSRTREPRLRLPRIAPLLGVPLAFSARPGSASRCWRLSRRTSSTADRRARRAARQCCGGSYPRRLRGLALDPRLYEGGDSTAGETTEFPRGHTAVSSFWRRRVRGSRRRPAVRGAPSGGSPFALARKALLYDRSAELGHPRAAFSRSRRLLASVLLQRSPEPPRRSRAACRRPIVANRPDARELCERTAVAALVRSACLGSVPRRDRLSPALSSAFAGV